MFGHLERMTVATVAVSLLSNQSSSSRGENHQSAANGAGSPRFASTQLQLSYHIAHLDEILLTFSTNNALAMDTWRTNQ